jgi:hypothetical protein
VLEDRTVPSAFTVLNLHDSGAGSLRAAVTAADATSGATIAFSPNLHGTITLTGGELDISSSVSINGPGADRVSVSGNNASRVFEVETGLSVTIKNLTITRGRAADQGGGILNDGSDLTLSADVLSQNVVFGSATSGGRGGGLRSLDGALTITDCTFTGNQALGGTSFAGDAIGGGVYVLAGTATISDSTFSGNVARGSDQSYDAAGVGGAMDIVSSATITGCTFRSNQAVGGNNGTDDFAGEAFGGALSGPGTVSISRSTFDHNQAIGGNGGTGGFVGESGGGAINAGTVTIAGSTFDHNQAISGSNGNSGTGDDDPFVDYSFGGAINVQGFTTLNVTHSGFGYNQAVGGNNATATGGDIVGVGGAEGGAILCEVGTTVSFSGCNLAHNQAIGGNGNSGSGPVVLVGEGIGGAIISGYGGADLGPNTVTVSN